MIDRTLSHHRILEKLGKGGMGVVYKALDLHLDRFVAVKVLPADKVSDPARCQRFVQEAKATSALNHPNIVTIYDIDQADGIHFMAMEFVAGKTLAS
jgi:eukaryotic-like serine/threonine-protein kinase